MSHRLQSQQNAENGSGSNRVKMSFTSLQGPVARAAGQARPMRMMKAEKSQLALDSSPPAPPPQPASALATSGHRALVTLGGPHSMKWPGPSAADSLAVPDRPPATDFLRHCCTIARPGTATEDRKCNKQQIRLVQGFQQAGP